MNTTEEVFKVALPPEGIVSFEYYNIQWEGCPNSMSTGADEDAAKKEKTHAECVFSSLYLSDSNNK